MKLKSIVLSIFLAASVMVSAQKESKMTVIKTYKVGGDDSSWDYLAINPQNNMLYVSHKNLVNILDKNTGNSVGTINETTGVHGFAFVPNSKKGYISCGRIDVVKAFDTDTNKVTEEIATGKNPDALFYEPFSKKIVVCNGRTADLSIIDPTTNAVTNTVALGGKPEEAVSNEKGKIFVNIEDKNEIAVVDGSTFSVISHWSLEGEKEPSGLAIDNKTHRLFSTCDKMLVILDSDNGKLIKKLPIGEGCDGISFDAKTNMIYTSNGEGNISVIHEDSANQFTLLKSIATKKGARTIAFDPAEHRLYLPTADFSNTEIDNRGRAKIMADSFQILVVGKP